MANKSFLNNPKLSSPWIFFIFALGWSWFFWILTIVFTSGLNNSFGIIGYAVGGLGPMLAGISLTYLTQGKEERRDYWIRIIDIKRIKLGWYLFIFLFVPIATLIASILDILIGGSGSTLEKAALSIISTPLSIIPFVLYLFFIGPFIEELGWRGYVLDRLQGRWNALISSLILGFIWAAWHLPLFYIKGTYQYSIGAGTLSFWLFMLITVSEAIILTWIFNNSNRSIFAAILFHFMVNFTGELIAASKNTEIFLTLIWILTSVMIITIRGRRTFTRVHQ